MSQTKEEAMEKHHDRVIKLNKAQAKENIMYKFKTRMRSKVSREMEPAVERT